MRYQHFYTKALSFIILGYDWIILIRLHQITRGLFPNSQKSSGKKERLSWYLMRRNQVTSLLSQLSRPSTLPAMRYSKSSGWIGARFPGPSHLYKWKCQNWGYCIRSTASSRYPNWNKFHFEMCRISSYSRASPVILCYNLID